jgi:hypothetical protein
MGDIKTPWAEPPVSTPGTEGSLPGTKGGFDLVDNAPKETPNSVSGLGLQPATVSLPDGPGVGTTVPVPDLTNRIPGTIDK